MIHGVLISGPAVRYHIPTVIRGNNNTPRSSMYYPPTDLLVLDTIKRTRNVDLTHSLILMYE